jgi:hypothetical protein
MPERAPAQPRAEIVSRFLPDKGNLVLRNERHTAIQKDHPIGDEKFRRDFRAGNGRASPTARWANYLSEAISKLGASNRVEAARIARTKGWL